MLAKYGTDMFSTRPPLPHDPDAAIGRACFTRLEVRRLPAKCFRVVCGASMAAGAISVPGLGSGAVGAETSADMILQQTRDR